MSAIKRCISMVLVLCLYLSLIPAVSAAEDRSIGHAGITNGITHESIMPLDRTDAPSAFGIDVSHHQGTIDWDTVATQIDFAIIFQKLLHVGGEIFLRRQFIAEKF